MENCIKFVRFAIATFYGPYPIFYVFRDERRFSLTQILGIWIHEHLTD
jgi:hypothetical protein